MDHLAVFAKYWQPGHVKTRLAKTIGHHAASKIYLAFLTNLLSRFEDLGNTRTIVGSPADRLSEFSTLSRHWNVQTQTGHELGDRLRNYFTSVFDATNLERDNDQTAQDHYVVVIGSDSPTMPRSFLNDAFKMLRKSDATIGPTEDGGYYLIGMRNNPFDLFENVRWSTEQVFEQTMENIRKLGLNCHVLPEWKDVDEFSDLELLMKTTLESTDQEESFSELFDAIAGILEDAQHSSDES